MVVDFHERLARAAVGAFHLDRVVARASKAERRGVAAAGVEGERADRVAASTCS